MSELVLTDKQILRVLLLSILATAGDIGNKPDFKCGWRSLEWFAQYDDTLPEVVEQLHKRLFMERSDYGIEAFTVYNINGNGVRWLQEYQAKLA